MTREEFLTNITGWDELKDFCSEYGSDYCDDIYDDYDMSVAVDEDIDNYGGDYSWNTLRDLLNDIPTNCDYYRRNSAFDWEEADTDMFEGYKSDVCAWADRFGDIWDEEDEEASEDCPEEAEMHLSSDSDGAPVEKEDFSVGELLDMCSVALVTIQKDQVRQLQENRTAFEQFVEENIPKILK